MTRSTPPKAVAGHPPEKGLSGGFDAFLREGRLPGRWGVAQAIVEAFAAPRGGAHRGLWAAKAALASIAAIREQQVAEERNGMGHLAEDPWDRWAQQAGYQCSTQSFHTDRLVRVCCSSLTPQVLEIGATEAVYLYQLTPALSVAFPLSPNESGARGDPWFPIALNRTYSDFRAALADYLWGTHGDRITIGRTIRGDDEVSITIEPTPQPDDHVADPDAESGLVAIEARVGAFLSAGMTRRVVLVGPPGTGKTTMAQALAGRIGHGRTISLTRDSLSMNGWQNLITILGPTTVIVDDFDRCHSADNLLQALEELPSPILFIGTVNTLDTMDPALLRPGRFDEIHRTKVPQPAQVRRIAQHYADKMGVDLPPGLVRRMEGMSPAGIREVVQCLRAVGPALLSREVERVRAQERLQDDDACGVYLRRKQGLMAESDAPKPMSAA